MYTLLKYRGKFYMNFKKKHQILISDVNIEIKNISNCLNYLLF